MSISTETLLEELSGLTRTHISKAKDLLLFTETELNYRKSNDSWSILECIEHLNRYFKYYNPEIQRRIDNAPEYKLGTEKFKPGFIGNYFAKSMLPKQNFSKIKTFPSMNPIGSSLNKLVIQNFIIELERFLNLLKTSQKLNLNRIKTNISISKFITLKLGDTFRIVTYHNERHIQQIERIIENYNSLHAGGHS